MKVLINNITLEITNLEGLLKNIRRLNELDNLIYGLYVEDQLEAEKLYSDEFFSLKKKLESMSKDINWDCIYNLYVIKEEIII